MNPLATVSWFWRGWRGRSVTFAALFAFSVLGVSVMAGFRHILKELGAPWYLWLFIPIVVVTALARRETEWMPDPELRRRWAWGLVFGSILIALLAAKLAPSKSRSDSDAPTQEHTGRR